MAILIQCKYLPATNTKPSRIKATAYHAIFGIRSVTIPYSYDVKDAFHAAAEAWKDKYDESDAKVFFCGRIDSNTDAYAIQPFAI